MAKSRLQLVSPRTENRTVPLRRPNAALRTREYLTDAEVAKLMKAAGGNRWGQRDATMTLTAHRHGLRVSELTDLRWIRLISTPRPWQCGGLRGDRQQRIQFGVMNCGPSDGYNANRSPDPRLCLPRNAVRRSPLPGLRGWLSALASRRSLASNLTLICCDTPAGLPWRISGMIPARCKPIWATRTFSIPSAIPSLPPIGSRNGGSEACLKMSATLWKRRRALFGQPPSSHRPTTDLFRLLPKFYRRRVLWFRCHMARRSGTLH